MEQLINNGFVVLNKLTHKPAEKTIIVLGLARSGTSMVAALLEKMGVFMGSQIDSAVFEDIEMVKLLEQGEKHEIISSFIEKRNQQHKMWGFKRPKAHKYINEFAGLYRNIHFVIPFRDVLAIALRNCISMKADMSVSLRNAYLEYAELLSFVEKSPYPCFLFSFEKAMVKPIEFMHGLAAYLDIELNAEMETNGLSSIKVDPKKYLLSSRIDAKVGRLQQIKNGFVEGKAHYSANDKAVSLDVFVDGVFKTKIKTYKKSYSFFSKLIKIQEENSFKANIRKYLKHNEINIVSVKYSDDHVEIENSPQEYFYTGMGI